MPLASGPQQSRTRIYFAVLIFEIPHIYYVDFEWAHNMLFDNFRLLEGCKLNDFK